MNMFARFDENPAMTLQNIKETKRFGRTDARTDAHTHARMHTRTDNMKTVYPPQTKFAYPPQTKFAYPPQTKFAYPPQTKFADGIISR